MKSLSFSSSAIAGFALSLLGVGALYALSWWSGHHVALKLVTILLAGGYCAYLMHRSTVKTGHVVVPAIWLVTTVCLFSFVSPAAMIAVQTAFIWIIRSLYFHSGILASGADALLSVCALGIGTWALQNSNWFLAFWSFFLIQSLAVWIPQLRRSSSLDAEQKFSTAAAHAHDALRRITSV
jgi:hypothetical protein